MANRVILRGLDDAIDKLEEVGGTKAVRRAMERSVKLMVNVMADYPVKAPGAFSSLALPRQKRAFHAKYGAGPYARTGTLGRQWTDKVEQGGRRGVVGNTTPYATFVQGEAQQPFHAMSGWPQAEQELDRNSGKILGFFRDEYRRIINS